MKPSLWIRGSPSFIFRPSSLQEKVDSWKKLAVFFPHVLQESKSQSRCFLNKVHRKRSAFFFPLFPDDLDPDIMEFTRDRINRILWFIYPSTIFMLNSLFPISYNQLCAFHFSCKGIYFCLANLNCSIALLPTGDKYTSSFVSSLSAGGLMGVKEELGSARQGRNSSY